MLDAIVIGAGPAGVIAALRAADLGARTALVTRDDAEKVILCTGGVSRRLTVPGSPVVTMADLTTVDEEGGRDEEV